MLEVNNLQTSYGQSQVLFGIDLKINQGEVVTLIGRNGMGKTTTINSIMGLVKTKSGEIIFDGRLYPQIATIQNFQDRNWPCA
ncbi:MAG: hypothetical protein CM1200mP30_06950 [Pseudomonadota bacterium]|nr:MAG: hypothetical protein CM1200mP30_06950 [Pseudomonadota bacterium]